MAAGRYLTFVALGDREYKSLDVVLFIFRTVIDTNPKGYFLAAQAVVPQMIERGCGKIINSKDTHR
ncbi:MAG: hypothetical protein PVI06_01410 [Desulfobacterales bacterium]